MANKLDGKEVLSHGTGYVTVYPSYNAVFDGFYLNSWDDMLQRLEKPLEVDITINDLKKLKDSDAKKALALKFKGGGYECGPAVLVKDLKSGDIKPSRATGTPKLKQYNLVVIDADGPKDGVLDSNFDNKLKEVLGDYEYYAHSTISSTETAKRRRIVIPLASPVTADVREAFIRFLSDKLGMQNVDKASKNARQMMCFPVYTKDGEKYSYHNTGKLMQAVDWLPAGWDDVSNWPKWDDEKKIKCNKISGSKKRLDIEQGEWIPCFDRNKLHYAYNKTYRISDVLKASGRYVQDNATRWSHTYDSVKGGIQVTNDSWIWSHYGNDALSTGTPLDAYETAMILRFGSLDKDNWKRMLAEVSKDEAVKKTMLSESEIPIPDDAETWAVMYDLSTEEGIAKLCSDYYPHQMRGGAWWRYEGGIYSKVKDEPMVQDALAMIRACSYLFPDNEDLQNMVGRVNTGRNIVYLWKGIKSTQEIPDEQWENQPNLMHFSDTCIDMVKLVTGDEYKVPHNPDFLMTQTTGYPWSDVENIDVKALDEVITNMELYLPDEKVRNYTQMALGRALIGTSCNEDKCVWLLSAGTGKKSGGNGKSTVLCAIGQALGGALSPKSYYYSLESDVLYYNKREKGSEGPTPKKNGMRNRRFVSFTEFDWRATLDDAKYKNYCSAGIVNGRGMAENGGNFRLKACTFIDTNGQPGIRGKDHGMLRRTRFIPWETELKGDTNIKAKWETDHKIGVAMMYWLILGLKMWVENGKRLDYGVPDDKNIPDPVMQETITWYESFSDPMNWFDENYVITRNPDDYLIFEDCFREYNEQVFQRGVSDYTFKQMEGRWLREHGITTKLKKLIPDTGTRRLCYVGVYLVTKSRANFFGNSIGVVEDKEPDEVPVKKEVVVPNIFKQDDIDRVV